MARTGWTWRGLAVWVAGGLALGLRPVPTDGLRATFLSVGHGCAVLVELPAGRTLLFDAGSFVDGRRAQRTIQSALWSYGHSRLDAVVVSHADVDHFNGLPGLAETTPIGSVLLAPSSLDFTQAGVVDLCEGVARCGVPIRLVQSGDTLPLDPEVTCEVLHPPADFRAADDNANSVVLKLTYRDRSLLLTGDLEGSGLDRVLSLPGGEVDVLMSPHHGSRGANPPALGVWASPQVVIASAADTDAVENLRHRAMRRTRRMYSTATSGAITVTISPQGRLQVREFVRAIHDEPAAVAAGSQKVDVH